MQILNVLKLIYFLKFSLFKVQLALYEFGCFYDTCFEAITAGGPSSRIWILKHDPPTGLQIGQPIKRQD